MFIENIIVKKKLEVKRRMYKGRILDTKTEGLSKPPVAVIDQKDLDLILGFALLNYPQEINGRGYIHQVGNVFNIKDIFILSQEASIGSVDEDENAIHKYIVENLDKDFDLMNFQWHSHPGEVYFSSRDQKSIRKWGKTMNFLLSLVVNRKSEYVCRLDIFEPIELSMEIPLIVTREISDETIQFCQDEIAEKVTIAPVVKVHRAIIRKQELPIGSTVVVPFGDISIRG